jgi:hypothetical protein
MTNPIRIWIGVAHHPAHRCGGWAFVRSIQGEVTGAAGGDRYTTAHRLGVSGLAAALRDLPPVSEPTRADPIAIQTTSPELAGFASLLRDIGGPGQAAGPGEGVELWARIIAASMGRRLSLIRTPLEQGAPGAFAAAWADLAMNKAKASGPFASAIPKANLAKVPGLDLR